MQQVKKLHKRFDKLQTIYGAPNITSIYGAGDINKPKVMFIFMNPTGRNISCNPNWQGIRAPWLGTKNVWKIFSEISLISQDSFQTIKKLKPQEWNVEFSHKVYSEIMDNKAYITNLAKCTQLDARPLPNSLFKSYRDLILEEILAIMPSKIITFGNQVSSILIDKIISVSQYPALENETLLIGKLQFPVYPVFYPVGQGQRNMPLAISRIKTILSH